MPRSAVCLTLLLFSALSFAPPLQAHDRSTSYSTWEIRGREARVVTRLTELDLSRYAWTYDAGDNYDALVGRYLTSNLRLFAADTPCTPTTPARRLASPSGRVAMEWIATCPPSGDLELRTRLFLDVAPSHLHFARVRIDQEPARERLLSEADPAWSLASPDAAGAAADATSLLDYIALGIEHILSGYDHLAFVLALLLIGGGLGEVARVVTGFTLAHSITLALTVLGYVQPDNAPVEALIGLSIFLVAAENAWLLGPHGRALPFGIAAALAALALLAELGYGRIPGITLLGLALFTLSYFELLRCWPRRGSLRWAIAFVFGLIHGFGFAAVLGEAGLPSERILGALLGFNLGVEIGQLGVVALIWPLLRQLLRRPDKSLGRWVVELGSAAVAGLGMFWFVTRAFG